MASGDRIYFGAESPIPAQGVTRPDVFPAGFRQGQGHLDLHDILNGHVPLVEPGEGPQKGWLRIALDDRNYGDLNYISSYSNLSEEQRLAVQAARRTVSGLELEVDATMPILRSTTGLDRDALEPTCFEEGKLIFPSRLAELLTWVKPAETAIAFSGRLSVEGAEMPAQGVHFRSGHLNGWVSLGREAELAPR